MSQSLIRKNFSDIVLDPTTIAVVGSIAVHAIVAANLAFFTQPSKQLKKPEPGTVKVVALTPTELQRIPQAPKSVPIPTPSQQVLPPVYQPSTPAPPVNQPINPPIATDSNTIPLSPTKKVAAKSPVIRIPPKQKVVTKPSPPKKDQKATPQAQPEPPTFDPDISFKPAPNPSPTSDKPKVTKPSPSPSPTTPKQKITSTIKPSKTQTERDGEQLDERKPSKPPDRQDRKEERKVDIDVPLPGKKKTDTPKVATSPSPQPTPGTQPGDGNGDGTFERKYASAVNTKLTEYIKKYPGIKIQSPSAPILKPYPPGVACNKVKEPPFIVLIVFGKVPENQDNDVLGTSIPESFDVTTFGIDNKELSTLAKKFGVEAAIEADKNRPPADKGKQFLYQSKVQFDPKTCKQ